MNSQVGINNQTLENKLQSKMDLYEYMKSHLNIWLPRPQYCRLSFLQQIIQDKKKCLKTSEVKLQNIKDGWNEFAVKNIWQYIKNDEQLQEYLPWEEMKEGRFPDKEFVWGVAFSIRPNWAQKYYDLCVKERNKVTVSPFQKKTIIVSEFWQQKLAEHEFVSKNKKNKKQSIIIEQAVKPYKKRDVRNKVIVELYSNEVQNKLKETEINQFSQNINPFQFDFSASQNKQGQINQPSIFSNEGKPDKSSRNFQFAFNQNEELQENKDPNQPKLQNQSILNMGSMQISKTLKNSGSNSQMKTGPSKKRRPEQFRETNGEDEDISVLKDFNFLAEKNENEPAANRSPHKSAKKHKSREDNKE